MRRLPTILAMLLAALSVMAAHAMPADIRAKYNANPAFLQAQTLLNQKHDLGARQILLKLCAGPSATPEMLSCLADTYLGDPELLDADMKIAETALNRAIKLDPEYGNAYKNLSKLANIREDYAASITFATRALAAKKPDIHARRQRALAYDKLHRDNEALADINQYMASGTTDPRNLLIKASILENLKRYDEAVAVYKESQKANYADGTCVRIASILETQGKFAEAVKTVNTLIKFNPLDANAYRIRARLENKSNDRKAAIADLTKAISLEPSMVLYKERAAIYTSMGQPREADADLKAIEKLRSREF